MYDGYLYNQNSIFKTCSIQIEFRNPSVVDKIPMAFPTFVAMNYVIVDVETTGGKTSDSKITEIALYKHDGQQIIDEFVSLVNPQMPIPPFIVNLTGINDKMVANAPTFPEIARKIVEFCQDSIFVAHNVGFDYGMIRSEYRRLGYDFRFPHLCTVKASRIVLPGHDSYSLGKIANALGIKVEGRHRAGGDALATVKLFEILLNKDPNGLKNFVQQEINPKIIHPNLSLEDLDNLPTRTGVYKFFDAFNKLIYIGKSINIKKRVEQHLRNTTTAKGSQMIKDIARVEFELTGSELIALLRESELVKIHKPLYNRQLRKSLFPFGLYDFEDDNGYLNLKVLSVGRTTAEPLTHFTTKKEGHSYLERIVNQYNLCQKCCDLYKTSSACFHYTIQECKGACVLEESVESYNRRVQEFINLIAFEGKSFYILDKGREKSEKSLVLIEKGVFKGYGFAPFHFNNLPADKWRRYIDLQPENKDIKTIINHALRKHQNLKIVELV